MKNIIEFYYQDEVIERREYKEPFVEPRVGDIINIQFTNPSYDEYGNWWVIMERRIIFFSVETPSIRQTLMLNVLPDPKGGIWESDPLYKEK
ncbi:hypothetical protein [Sphingobacterium sp. IITKGP-BTPF85]|uniref:hypothetical protein n=1 Tax=Sphingobacterium sp. IITKGP-BTPF85 TaxID=1338009 RepID=UPI000389E812|nr:hypothetical protein [Sphingobacterium sp. IITKGP-BTPF85]KKX47720.1 hypothetical protein L950_0225050 [Sphingobacterium sp. IITKGP-BTPF85]